MRIKLDENLGPSTAKLFRDHGHDVETVPEERLSGTDDANLYDVCIAEGRTLVTLDLDFADPIRFRSSRGPGIAVLRLHGAASTALLATLARTLNDALSKQDIRGRLWVVELGRIRIHEP